MTVRFYSKSETHREFSNFAPFPIALDGVTWPSTEHYYQAQKFTDAELREQIRKAAQPVIAKSLADKFKDRIRPDWDAVKDGVMYLAVKTKFETHRKLREMLLDTGDEDIAECAPADYYWGIGKDGTGQNRLGKILERIRAELRGMTPGD
jgi:hypothetical protein